MKHLRLAAWTVWFMLSWVALAHAGPVVGLIGAVGTFLASGTALANLALTAIFTAAKIGISLLMKADQKRQVAGVQADTKFGGDNPLSFVMGDFATPGQLEYANTDGQAHDVENAYLTHVLSPGDLPMALTGLWVDDKKITLPTMTGTPTDDMGWGVEEYQSESGSYYLWLQYEDGTQTTANSFLTTTFGSDPDRPWQSDMIGLGVPLLIPTARFNQKLHNGIPQYLAETSGIAQYDPRKDSSVGGSGTQRWEPNKAGTTASTYEPSSNPVVQIYNILRGIHYKGEHIWGGRCEAWQLPLASWMAMMNVCDTLITNADGSKEKQFRSGLEITTDQEPADVIEDILKGCNGRIAEMGGVYKVLVGTPGAAVYSFTDETIVVTEGQSLDPFPGLESTFNGAQASYPEPEEKWAAKDAPAYLRSDLEALDDDRRLVSGLQYPTVPYALQVQRLLQAAVQDARRFRVHQIVLPPEAWLLEPNDVVSWTSAWNGYEEKKFLITEIEGDSNFLQYVTLKEVDPADYSWDADTDEKSYSVGVIGAIVPAPQAMTGWQVSAATFESGGNKMPSIQVTFSGDQDDVRAVRVQGRLASDESLVFDGELPYGDPDENDDPMSVVLNGTFLPDTDYEVRGIFVPFSDRETEWSDWLPVTTPNVWISDIYPVDLDRLEDDVKGYLDFIGTGLREQVRRMEEIDLWIADQDFGNEYDRQQIRTQLTATFETAQADYNHKVDVLAAADLALSQSITTLEATVGGKADASVVSVLSAEVTSIGGDVTANSNAITALDSTVGNFSASGRFRVETEATETGAAATIGLSVSATEGGATEQAALFLSALTGGGSRVTVVADQFVVTDGVNTESPFLFTGGTGYLQNMKVQGADIVNLTVDWADIQNVSVDYADIDNVNITAGVIAANAVTDSDDIFVNDYQRFGAIGWTDLPGGSITLSSDSGNPVLLYYKMAGSVSGGTTGDSTVSLRIHRSDEVVVYGPFSKNAPTGGNANFNFSELVLNAVPSAGTYTYKIQYTLNAPGTGTTTFDGTLIAQCNRK